MIAAAACYSSTFAAWAYSLGFSLLSTGVGYALGRTSKRGR